MNLPRRSFLEWLAGRARAPRVLVATAHPDDETVGAGAVLARLGDAFIACATDGAPRRREWWGDPGLPSREAYAALRRRELDAALAIAGIAAERVRCAGIADQEASLHLATLVHFYRDAIEACGAEVVLQPAYEGGHPDHDAVAFAVHAACTMLVADGHAPPERVEYPLYHGEGDRMVVSTWLPGVASEGVDVELAPHEQALKQRMVTCHASQAATLAQFPLDRERFRPTARTDFTRPPHAGTLNYERFGWADGAEWRARVADACRVLGLAAPPGDHTEVRPS